MTSAKADQEGLREEYPRASLDDQIALEMVFDSHTASFEITFPPRFGELPCFD